MSPTPSLQEQIKAFPWWYHRIELTPGIVTPGHLPHVPAAYKVPEDLTGKRVLDVGAWDGYWTFEALKRGASQVVAIDNWSDMPHTDPSPRVEWDTFDFCKRILGYSDKQCQRRTMEVYDVAPARMGWFDVIFFFGALYHCRYPLLALDKLSAVCRGEIYIESAVADDYSPYRGYIGSGHGNVGDVLMEFFPGSEYGDMPTNWWSPTLVCLLRMVQSAGFGDVDIWKFDAPTELATCRGFCRGRKN